MRDKKAICGMGTRILVKNKENAFLLTSGRKIIATVFRDRKGLTSNEGTELKNVVFPDSAHPHTANRSRSWMIFDRTFFIFLHTAQI